MTSFTLKDVAKHNTPEDCWVIVDGQVYNVSSFVPRHPGGAMIYVKAGGECTQLFNSYHPEKARRVLQKYHIGQVNLTGEVVTHYEKEGEKDEFHLALKDRVEKYFRDSKLDPRFSISMYIKTFLIVATVAASAYATFYGASSYLVALLAATLLGVAMAEVGICIQHDANHGAFSRNAWICHAAGLTLDAVGASSFMWKQQHVVGHHAFTNVHGADPDIRVKPGGADVRRVTRFQPRAAHHALQHVYLGLLYSLLAIKSIVLDDFAALSEGTIGPVKLAPLAPHERLSFWCGKALFAAWFVVAPLVGSSWSVTQLAGLWLWGLMCCGWTLALMFQVAHVVDDVAYLDKSRDGKVAGSWAAQQVATSADFSHGSFFWTHFSGGLNYQVVHHLFPGIVHTHYPGIAPIVQEVAQEYGVPYKVYPTFWDALSGHFRHLKNVGSSDFYVPSLQTIG